MNLIMSTWSTDVCMNLNMTVLHAYVRTVSKVWIDLENAS